MGLSPMKGHSMWQEYQPPEKHPFTATVVKLTRCLEPKVYVAWLRYKDYDRVMILKDRPQQIVDPHFKENKDIIARFPATDAGFDNALAYVAFMNGGECQFDWLPGLGYNTKPGLPDGSF